MAKKSSASADPNDTTVAPKERKKKAPAEVINLPLRGGIIEKIRSAAKIYKVPVSFFMTKFAVGVEPHLMEIAKSITADLEAKRAAEVASLFESPSVEPVSDGGVPGDIPDHPYPGDTASE